VLLGRSDGGDDPVVDGIVLGSLLGVFEDVRLG